MQLNRLDRYGLGVGMALKGLDSSTVAIAITITLPATDDCECVLLFFSLCARPQTCAQAMQQYASWPDEALEDPHVREAAEAMFHTADIDGDGRLSARELQYGMLLIAQYAARELTFDIIGLVDKDGDGLLGREEALRASVGGSQLRQYLSRGSPGMGPKSGARVVRRALGASTWTIACATDRFGTTSTSEVGGRVLY